MSRDTRRSYLRLVDSTTFSGESPQQELDRTLLGFVDMSRVSDVAFEMILSKVRPSWTFDLRPVPYFNIGRLNRKRVFDLFRTSCTSYRDVAGALRITEHNDASLNSGVTARFLNEAMQARPCHTPVTVLVDDEETLHHAMSVLPRSLRTSVEAWCPMALDVTAHEDGPDLVLRSASGQVHALQAKWLGVRQAASASHRTRHHVVPHENGWAVRREGADRASVVTLTKEQAIERAREIAERECGGIIIHRENGTIQEERTYGADSDPPRS